MIVFRSVVAAALATSLFGAPLASPARAAAPVAIKTLTLEQRTTALPPDTTVTLGGRTTTLGTLRAEHVARMARLKNGASLGRAALEKLHAGHSVVGLVALATAKPRLPIGKTLRGGATLAAMSTPVPGSVAAEGSGNLKMIDPNLAKWASDYQDFCLAVNASACLYLPSDTTLEPGTLPGTSVPDLTDTDPFITDAGLCASEHGELAAEGCTYRYPQRSSIQFYPERLASTPVFGAQGSPVFAHAYDVNGSASCTYSGSSTGTSIGDPLTWCGALVTLK